MKYWQLLIIIVFLAGCSDDESVGGFSQTDQDLIDRIQGNPNSIGPLESYFLPSSGELNKIPQDPQNRISIEKLELGKFLFHETGLAQNPKREIGRETYSCASCHHVEGGFQADRFQGIGEGAVGFGDASDRFKHNLYQEDQLDVQPIRTPSALNIAYQSNVLWNGQFGATNLNENTEQLWTTGTPLEKNFLGFEGTEIQAIAGLDVHRLTINEDLVVRLGYKEMFDQVFPEFSENDRYSAITAGLAIAAYERTLLANEAPFQKWLRGDYNAMTEVQKLGANLFFGKAECTTCHNGPSLANMDFHALGMGDLFECPEPVFMSSMSSEANLGRASFTKDNNDLFKFKVPQLYNLKDSPFYGHGSSFFSVKEVLEYKNNALSQNANVDNSILDEHFVPLGLTDEEIDQLEQFISYGLYDSNLKRYVPSDLPSGNCFPNADLLSKQNLACN